MPLALIDAAGSIVFLNQSFTRTFGYKLQDVPTLAQLWAAALPEDSYRDHVLAEWQVRLERAKAASGPFEPLEVSLHCKDSSVRVARAEAAAVSGSFAPNYLIGLYDITELKRTEEALREREQQLRRVGDNLPSGMVYQMESHADGRRRFTHVSAGVERVHGVKAEDALKDASVLYGFILEDDRPALAAREAECFAALKPFHAEVRSRRPDGEVRWIYLGSAPTPLPDGRVIWDGLELDITERKRAEAALRDGESKYRALFAQTLVGVVQVQTATGRFLRVNQRLCDMLGYSQAELLSTNYQAITHPEDLALTQAAVRNFSSGPVDQETIEKRCIRKDGSVVWFGLRMLPLWLEGEKPECHLSLLEDITDRKQMQAALRESERRFATVFQSSPLPTAIGLLDDSRYTDANDAFLNLFGYSREEVLNRTALELGLWEAPEQRARLFELLHQTGHVRQFEAKFRRKSGEVGDLLMTARFIDLDGKRSVVSMLLDVTERKQMEERLRQSQKLEGIGHLAGGMAHEFNNLLAAMMMNLSLARMSESIESRGMLQEVEAGCSRAADLVRQLLAFSSQSVMERRSLDLTALILRETEMLKPLLGERIQVEFCSPQTPLWVKADKALIAQVLLNLCLNARDAMLKGGRLSLELTEESFGDDPAKARPEARFGRYVCLSVMDTGCGMDEKTRRHLFEPFFTTKDVGQGTGLGLATVRGIVQQHQGWIEVASQVDQGTTFKIHLPAEPPAAPASSSSPVNEKETEVENTILIVEDESRVRKSLQMLLTDQGYKVLEAADGLAALTVWAAYRSEIDLLFTDMIMPGAISGLQLAQQALAEKPGLKVIITSGYNTDAADLEKVAAASMVYLPKPCPPYKLKQLIAQCLGRRN